VTPMGYVFSMSYPESLALALTSLALLGALEGSWLLAGALAAIAVLARPEATVLVVPLAAIAWSRRDDLDPATRGRALAAVLAAPAAVVTYPLYLQWSLNDAGAWSQAETMWGRAFNLDGPLRAFEHLSHKIDSQPAIGRDLVFLVVYAALIAVAARRGIPAPWIAGGVFVLALPLFSSSVMSEARFGLLALPVYWGVAMLTQDRCSERVLLIGSLVLLVTGVFTLPYLFP
jgi:hypothetical protein